MFSDSIEGRGLEERHDLCLKELPVNQETRLTPDHKTIRAEDLGEMHSPAI